LGVRLDRREVALWLEGQREAQKVIEQERVRRLLRLSREEALSIYLGLWVSADRRAFEKPSGLLLVFRKAAEKLRKGEKG